MLLSPKFIDFMRTDDPVEFLEGTTHAGKTTVGVVKFMFKVAASSKKLHIISGLDLGTIEKNIINKDYGITDIFGRHVEYNASGRGQHSLPHIIYNTPKNGQKIIYILGYDNVSRWKKALGGQYGCVFIDEINIADMEYVREIAMRNDYLMGTLNPDDPGLPIYKEYIDKSRPYKKWEKDYPEELLKMLNQPANPGWRHWFFSFKDNIGVPEEKKQQVISMVAPGTKQYKNKILGLRGRSEGLVFDLQDRNLVPLKWLKDEVDASRIKWRLFTCGVDTSFSRQSDDLIAFVFSGITTEGHLYRLKTFGINNTDLSEKGQETLAPSDVPPLLHYFLDEMTKEWGRPDGVYIDSADAATYEEVLKYKRVYGSIYDFAKSYRKVTILDRVQFEIGWMGEYQNCAYIVKETNQILIDEMNTWSYSKNGKDPEDANDHAINANQYGWIPYRHQIGTGGNK